MGGKAKFYYDSKGRSHYVLEQEYALSCGPACVAMVEGFYKLKCMIDPEGRARQISQQYPGNFTLKEGTTDVNLYDVLNAEGVRTYPLMELSQEEIFDHLAYHVSERTPAIAHIRWSGGGGHFAVCRKVDSDNTVIFLDPRYGVVEVNKKDFPKYRSPGQLSGRLIFTYR